MRDFFSAKTISEYGLYLLAFLLPLQTRWILLDGRWEYSAYSLYLSDIILIFLAILFILEKKSKINLEFKKINVNILALIIFNLAIIISFFSASDKLLAFYYYFKILLGQCLILLILKADYNFFKLIYAFLFSAFLQACFGVWQFLAQASIANKWLGLAAHDPSVLGISVIENSGRWLRAYGGQDHPNIFGALLAIAILLVFYLLIKNKFKIINYVLLIIFAFALFFSFSRSAWLGLFLGFTAMGLVLFLQKDFLRLKNFFKAGFLVAVIFSSLVFNFKDLVVPRFNLSARLEQKSISERISSYQDSFSILKNDWFGGVGVGNYVLALAQKDNYHKANYSYQPVHNTFLLVWTEIGIFGFFSILILFFLFLKNSLLKNNGLSLALLGSLASMMMLDHFWWSLHAGVLFFCFTFAMVIRQNKNLI